MLKLTKLLVNNKNKTLYIILKVLLFIGFAALIFWQIQSRTEKYNLIQAFNEHFTWKKSHFLAFTIALMPFNIFLETFKWKIFISNFKPSFTIRNAWRSMLCGSFFGFMTPNRVGEFVGRLKRIEPEDRSRALMSGYWGGIAQFLVTFSFGVYMGGKTIVQHANIESIDAYTIPIAIAIILFTSFIYFNLKRVLEKISTFPLLKRITDKYPLQHEVPRKQLVVILIITLLRYMVYVCQYVFILLFFGVNLPFLVLFSSVSTMLVIHTVFPSVPFIDLGVKGNALILILKGLSQNELGVILSVFTIWIINIILPALLGYYYFIMAKKEKASNLGTD